VLLGAPPGDLYEEMIVASRKALGGKTPDSVVFVWMQGERDAKMGWHGVYEASLRGLIENVRVEFKRPDMRFVIGRLSDCNNGQKGWDTIRSIQQKVAESDRLGAWVNTDDLNDKDRKTIYTTLHYTTPSRATSSSANAAPSKRSSS
jgi:hypothetical protein